MTAPDHMPEAFENSLHETGHPHMEPPVNPGRFTPTSVALSCTRKVQALASK